MVKILRPQITEDIFSWVHFFHFGPPKDDFGPPWHLVHEYTGDLYWWMGTVTWSSQFLPDIPPAQAMARDLAALPQVVTDWCPYCHASGFQFGPILHLPRWNIYRGQSHEPIVPVFYWDIFDPDPPPGYEWSSGYPYPPP
jgi:hypothetical protein